MKKINFVETVESCTLDMLQESINYKFDEMEKSGMGYECVDVAIGAHKDETEYEDEVSQKMQREDPHVYFALIKWHLPEGAKGHN